MKKVEHPELYFFGKAASFSLLLLFMVLKFISENSNPLWKINVMLFKMLKELLMTLYVW